MALVLVTDELTSDVTVTYAGMLSATPAGTVQFSGLAVPRIEAAIVYTTGPPPVDTVSTTLTGPDSTQTPQGLKKIATLASGTHVSPDAGALMSMPCAVVRTRLLADVKGSEVDVMTRRAWFFGIERRGGTDHMNVPAVDEMLLMMVKTSVVPVGL